MKLALILGTLLLTTIATASELPQNVLVEHATHVGFAPPSHRGTFKWQILSSGVVQKIDNKNKKTVLSKLSPEMVKTLASAIERIKNVELKKPEGRPCMDAPSMDITVQQNNGTLVKIWRRAGCRDFTSTDSLGASLAETVQELRNALFSIEYLDKLE